MTKFLRNRRRATWSRLAPIAAGLACAAAYPGTASAAMTGTLSVGQSGSAAASAGSLTFTANFTPPTQSSQVMLLDAPPDVMNDLTLTFPQGLMLDETLAGGACLTATAPAPQCLIGSGSATPAGSSLSEPMSLYMVQPPAPTAALVQSTAPALQPLAGIELVTDTATVVGTLQMRSSTAIGVSPSLGAHEEIAFTNLAATPFSGLQATITDLHLPTGCAAATVGMSFTSQYDPVEQVVTAPFAVTGCLELGYQPFTSEAIARDPGSANGTFSVHMSFRPGDSTSQRIDIGIPPSLAISRQMTPCFDGQHCTVGTVSATSPLMPAAQLQGTIQLAGTVSAPIFEVNFAPPLALVLPTNWTPSGLHLLGLPDIPLATLDLNFTGNSLGRMFEIQCYQTGFSTTFSPSSGITPVNVKATVPETGCTTPPTPAPAPAPVIRRPAVTASLAGWGGRHLSLSVMLRRGTAAPIKSVTIDPPSGLKFRAGALAHGSARVISVAGAQLERAQLRSGRLVLTLRHAVAGCSVKLSGALLMQLPGHRQKPVRLTVTLASGGGAQSERSAPLHTT